MEVLRTSDKFPGGLYSEISSDIQKELNIEKNRFKTTSLNTKNPATAAPGVIYEWDGNSQQWVATPDRQDANATQKNASVWDPLLANKLTDNDGRPVNSGSTQDIGKAIVRFPAALPVNLLPVMLRSPQISSEEFELLRSIVFTPDILNNSVTDHYLAPTLSLTLSHSHSLTFIIRAGDGLLATSRNV